jgi:Gpi18-like mannosyltransferase
MLGCVALVMTVTFYPVSRAYELGQIQAVLTCLVAAAVWLWSTGRHVPAGVAVGLSCAIKPQLGLLIPWAAIWRRWGVATATAATLLALVAAAVLAYGLRDNLNYLDALAYLSRHGESYVANQSPTGLLNRWIGNGDSLVTTGPSRFPPV